MDIISRDLFYTKADDESSNSPRETLPEAMQKLASQKPDFAILRYKSNENSDFDMTITSSKYLELVKKAGKSFIKLGLDVKSAVGIIGFNHPAWCISQYGCIFAGGVTCGIYTTNTAEVCRFIMNDCCCQILVVENTPLLTKILSIIEQCPQIKAIIQYTGEVSHEYRDSAKVPIYTWDEFLNLSSNDPDEVLDERTRNIKPEDVALLIYTSGTTGMPKGVMLSQDNVVWAGRMVISSVKLKPFTHSLITYLPYSHIAANMLDVIVPILMGATIYFAQPDALKGSLGKTLKEVRPTVFLGVPRVFEKIQEQMQEFGLKSNKLKKLIARWAKRVGYRNSMAKQSGKSTNFSYTMAKLIVFKKIRQALGLDRCVYVFSGAAPISQKTLDYFLSLDIMIHQVYGMTECSGPHSMGYTDLIRIGSAGTLMKGAEMKIVDIDEKGIGEICMKGRHVFLGYHNAVEKTREVLDQDGWLHSGDLGKVEDGEFIRITGRIKELIITAGGENVAPVPIEDRIKESLPFISNAILIGDQRKYIVCLLTLKTVLNMDTQEPTNILTPGAVRCLQEMGIIATSLEDVLGHEDQSLGKAIDVAIRNANNKSVSRAAFVQKWTFLHKDFSIPGGELGPTLKLKRHIITERYADEIEKLYQ